MLTLPLKNNLRTRLPEGFSLIIKLTKVTAHGNKFSAAPKKWLRHSVANTLREFITEDFEKPPKTSGNAVSPNTFWRYYQHISEKRGIPLRGERRGKEGRRAR